MNKFTKFVFGAALAVAFSIGAAVYAYDFGTATLSQGSNGTYVVELQSALNANGANPALVTDGAFGPATKAAVMAYQSMKGLVSDGIVGPATKAALNSGSTGSYPAGCTSNSGYSTTTGQSCASTSTMPAGCMAGYMYSPTTGESCTGGSSPSSSELNGGAGDITVDLTSEFAGEEVGEDQEDVPVLAFTVEADDDSDVMINSVKVELSQNTGADSDKLDDYVDSISIWFNGDKVGEADADSFNESSDVYSKSISLDNVIVRAGDEEKLTVAITALSNLDSGDIDSDQWNIGVTQIRFTDGDDVVTTDTFSLDTTDGLADDEIEQLFDFEDFAGAADVELKAALDEDAINDAHVLNVDDTNDTTHDILSFTLEARGDSDIWVDEIPVVITTTGEADEAVIVIEASLWHKGEKIGSKDVPTGGAVTFDDLDLTIDAGDKEEFIVRVELQDIDGALDDGDTVQATLTVASIDAEDEAGDTLAGGDLTGTAVGGAHAAYEAGIMVKFVSQSATAVPSGLAGVNDFGTFKIVFDVTAFDSDVYVDGTAIADEAGGATYQDIVAANIAATGVLDCADCEDGANTTFKVDEGTTERFTLTMSGAGDDVFANGALESVLYALTAIDGDVVYNFSMEEFTTDNVFLSGND